MPDPIQPAAAPSQLEAGAYEVIRQRLNKHGAELQRRLDLLNDDRKKEFGGIETALLATSRLTTDNNCVPRDMTAIGPKRFLFGYNVHLGLRTSMRVEDVFTAVDWQADDHSFHPNKDGLLGDTQARIGWVSFSKSGRTVYYGGRSLKAIGGRGVRGNFIDEDSGEEFWVSGIKKRGSNAHDNQATSVAVDEDAQDEYQRLRSGA